MEDTTPTESVVTGNADPVKLSFLASFSFLWSVDLVNITCDDCVITFFVGNIEELDIFKAAVNLDAYSTKFVTMTMEKLRKYFPTCWWEVFIQ